MRGRPWVSVVKQRIEAAMKGKPGSGPVLSGHAVLATPSYWQVTNPPTPPPTVEAAAAAFNFPDCFKGASPRLSHRQCPTNRIYTTTFT